MTETDPAYMLRPEKIEFMNVLKPKEGDNVKKLMREFLDTTPGFDSLRYIGKMNLEHRNYYRKRTNLPTGKLYTTEPLNSNFSRRFQYFQIRTILSRHYLPKRKR